MIIKKNNDGENVIEFFDACGDPCSVDEDTVGKNKTKVLWIATDTEWCVALGQKQLIELLPHFIRFIKTGNLSKGIKSNLSEDKFLATMQVLEDFYDGEKKEEN